MIRSVSYEKETDELVLSQIACICSECIYGKFDQCLKYRHVIVRCKRDIQTRKSKITRKENSSYNLEEEDFNQFDIEWDKKYHENIEDNFNINASLDESLKTENQDASSSFQSAAPSPAAPSPAAYNSSPFQSVPSPAYNSTPFQSSPSPVVPSPVPSPIKISSSPIQISSSPLSITSPQAIAPTIQIDDDPEYWERSRQFNEHLRTLYLDFAKRDEFHEFCSQNLTLEKLNFNQMREIWDDILRRVSI